MIGDRPALTVSVSSLTRREVSCAALATAFLALAGCDRANVGGGGPPRVAASELQAAATDPRVKAFYAARNWQAAWTPAAASAFMEALKSAQNHGLNSSQLASIVHSAEGQGARDAELTLAAITYAQALATGATDPNKTHGIFTLDRPKVDLAAGLEQALQGGKVPAWLESLAPQDEEYRTLSKAYVAYRAEADRALAAPLPPGPTLKVGAQDVRVPQVAQRLAVTGYLPQGTYDGQVWTHQFAEALKSLQRDAGLPDTGRLDDQSTLALNFAPADRARTLAVNLERRRWLARTPAATRIDVNTAAAELVYLKEGKPAWTSRTVVGSPDNPTPALGGSFKQLVVNPPWNVPQGIAEKEIFPKGDAYLAAQDMYVEDGRVVQRPGPKAALGAVKFDMQNRYAIYLHDTPAKAIFATERRHRSHGCVRVEKAVEFARFLANETGAAQAFDDALASGETKTVALGREIPVRLLYHTAFVGQDGRLLFADDAYGWDEKVGEALGLDASHRSARPRLETLIGP
jgi:murein L,D-transpeptidase YcbB/YkuD